MFAYARYKTDGGLTITPQYNAGTVWVTIASVSSANITTLILPKENEKDVSEIPAYIRDRFRIEYVDVIGQVAKLALIEA